MIIKLLSKRIIFADNDISNFDSHPDFYNQETAETDNYMSFHEQKLLDQEDIERFKNNPYSKDNSFGPVTDIQKYLIDARRKNVPWKFLPK